MGKVIAHWRVTISGNISWVVILLTLTVLLQAKTNFRTPEQIISPPWLVIEGNIARYHNFSRSMQKYFVTFPVPRSPQVNARPGPWVQFTSLQLRGDVVGLSTPSVRAQKQFLSSLVYFNTDKQEKTLLAVQSSPL